MANTEISSQLLEQHIHAEMKSMGLDPALKEDVRTYWSKKGLVG